MELEEMARRIEDLSRAHDLDIMTMRAQTDRIKELEKRCLDHASRLNAQGGIIQGMLGRLEELEKAVRALAETGQIIVRKLDQAEIRLADLEESVGEMMPVNFGAAMPVEEEEEPGSYAIDASARQGTYHISDSGLVREQKTEIEEDIWEGSEWI